MRKEYRLEGVGKNEIWITRNQIVIDVIEVILQDFSFQGCQFSIFQKFPDNYADKH